MSVHTQIYWPYMFSGIYYKLNLYVQYTKNQAIKKWLPFKLICALFLEYIIIIHFVRPYPNLLTLYVQYTKTLAVKKWLPFEPICAVYIVTLNSSSCSNLVQIWICRKIKCTPLSLALLSWAGCIINRCVAWCICLFYWSWLFSAIETCTVQYSITVSCRSSKYPKSGDLTSQRLMML